MATTTPPSWASLIITALCRGLLVMVASMALWAVLPAALGWHVTVVMSGSMEPALRSGDVVASRPISGSSVRPGQVILVDDPDHEGRLRLHRLSKVNENGQLVLRGDANRTDDSTPVSRNAVHGVGSLRVPFIGAPAYWLRTHQIVPLVPTGLAAVLIVLGAIGRRTWPDDDHDSPNDDAHGSAIAGERSGETDSASAQPVVVESRAQLRALRAEGTGRGRARRPSRKTLVILTTVALTAAAVTADAPAQAASAFKASTVSATSSWSAAYWNCSAAVLADSPYLYYPFSEKSGATAGDASGNGRNGGYEKSLLGSGITYGAAGPCTTDGATGVTLDGTSGWVSTPGSITAPKTFTTEIWFRTTTTRGGALIAFRSPVLLGLFNSYDRQLYLDNSGRLLFGLSGDTVSTIASTRSYNDGSWHLADVTTSSTGSQLYVDGAKVAGDTAMVSPVDATGAWRIGDGGFTRWPSAPASDRPAATVQGVAIYPTALSSAQVAAHYAAR